MREGRNLFLELARRHRRRRRPRASFGSAPHAGVFFPVYGFVLPAPYFPVAGHLSQVTIVVVCCAAVAHRIMEAIEVQRGETLVAISVRENVSVTTLRRINKLYGNDVYEGQILNLRSPPPKKPAAATATEEVVVSLSQQPQPQSQPHEQAEETSPQTSSSARTEEPEVDVVVKPRTVSEPARPDRSFASAFRMAAKALDSSSAPSSSLLSASTRVPTSVFFFGGGGGDGGASCSSSSNSSSGGNGNSNGNSSSRNGFGAIGGLVSTGAGKLAGALSLAGHGHSSSSGSFGSNNSNHSSSSGSSRSWKGGLASHASSPTLSGTSERDADTRGRASSVEATPPVLIGEGKILRQDYAVKLRRLIPPRLQIENWRLLYSVLNDGADLTTFFRKAAGYKCTVLLVETICGEVFGGFNASEWGISPNFCASSVAWPSCVHSFSRLLTPPLSLFSLASCNEPDGTGECFLFRFTDDEHSTCERFPWTGDNNFFVYSSHDQVAMGGGGHGFGFVLDSDFATGESFCSATYGNTLLVTKEKGCFRIKNLELWGFEGIFGKVLKRSGKNYSLFKSRAAMY